MPEAGAREEVVESQITAAAPEPEDLDVVSYTEPAVITRAQDTPDWRTDAGKDALHSPATPGPMEVTRAARFERGPVGQAEQASAPEAVRMQDSSPEQVSPPASDHDERAGAPWQVTPSPAPQERPRGDNTEAAGKPRPEPDTKSADESKTVD
jgi:hypothetical protein